MSFRRKLVAVFALTVFLSVVAVTWLVSAVTRRAFQRSEDERAATLVAQFRREFNRRGEIVTQRVAAIAASEPLNHMTSALNRAPADSGPYFESAKTIAENDQLDFLEFLEADGTIVSSAQWPEKFGYPESSFASLAAEANQGFFLQLVELQDGAELGLLSMRATRAGEHPVYVIGGRRLDRSFLSGLDMPAGMRVLLYQNRGDRFSTASFVDPGQPPAASVRPADKLQPLIESARQSKQERAGIVQWSRDPAGDEEFHAIPLTGIGSDSSQHLLAILLIANSRSTYVTLMRRIRSAALMAGAGGIVLAILLSSWAAGRVTRPVERLAHAAREVAAGNWDTRVELGGNDELSQLADSFNRMTAELLAQKERLIQAERVAAWRELARRLAHELKNPLFPLQLTVENLVRARAQTPAQFEDVFGESSRTLLAEIENLRDIISRFSDFSKMPQPQLQSVSVNEVIRGLAQLFQAQFQAPGRAKIICELQLDPDLQPVAADPDLLHRAISNLLLNAIEAMPQGGTLTLRTRDDGDKVFIEVADTGEGLTPDECARIFTPYYTSKQRGTGLGLAIVQSIVSDHKGRIHAEIEPGLGTNFVVELPKSLNSAAHAG
jgi:two-component system, NtrC family, nitrogen regulation sensor histidine kinase NtrY